MTKLRVFSLCCLLSACGQEGPKLGNKSFDKARDSQKNTSHENSDQGYAEGTDIEVVSVAEEEVHELVLQNELQAPKEFGGPWLRRLSVGAHFAYVSIEKWDEAQQKFLPIGFFDETGNFDDTNISSATQYRIGSSYLSEKFSPIFDLLLNGEVRCQDQLLAHRIVVPESSHIRLGNCPHKWTAESIVVEGEVRSFYADEENGASASSLHLQAQTILGSGRIYLNGQKGRSGSHGKAGAEGEEGKDGHKGFDGVAGGNGGDAGMIVFQGELVGNIFTETLGGKGGDGGIGGRGGKAGPELCIIYDGLRSSKRVCQRGKDGVPGKNGEKGSSGRSGFVTKLGALK